MASNSSFLGLIPFADNVCPKYSISLTRKTHFSFLNVGPASEILLRTCFNVKFGFPSVSPKTRMFSWKYDVCHTLEHLWHHSLKDTSHWTKASWHPGKLECALCGDKRCQRFGIIVQFNLMVSVFKVEFCEKLCTFEHWHKLIDVGKGKVVHYDTLIQTSLVDTRSELTIRLPGNAYWRNPIGHFHRFYHPTLQHLIQQLLHLSNHNRNPSNFMLYRYHIVF